VNSQIALRLSRSKPLTEAAAEDPRGTRRADEHALIVLEFPRVLECIAARATSDGGREAVRELRPFEDVDQVRAELGRVQELRRLLADAPRWAMPVIPALRDALARLRSHGTLEGIELHEVGVLLTSGSSAIDLLGPEEAQAPLLHFALAALYSDSATSDQITNTVDEAGAVQDRASQKLRSVRKELRTGRSALVTRLESFLRNLPDRVRVPDASMTIRDGRYCIPVRREGRRSIGGIVHDESATGSTLFVEPPVAIRLMNELRALEREEVREVARILGEWSERLRPVADALEASLEALVRLDSLRARAVTADRWQGAVPEIDPTDAGVFEVVQGRHPLLIEEGVDVVPFSVRLEPHERVLVVSGPNTGGKSVFLKALGLLPALAQSGIIPPVEAGSRFPVFTGFLADIGDEQSIAANLSTFSAHLVNLAEIVTEARRGTLALVDELGTGTDPTDGAPLSRAIVEELAASGARAVVTTHLGKLKEMDTGQGSSVVNASLQFDGAGSGPTYAFQKGRPGRSYGLAIARRLGFPGPLLDRAEALRGAGEMDLEQLLERTADHERRAADSLQNLQATETDTVARLAEVERREEALHKREADAEAQAQERARELLLEARKEVESAIEELRQEAGANAAQGEAARRARGRVEGAARALESEAESAVDAAVADASQAGSGPALEPGDLVQVPGSGAKGIIRALRGDRAEVTLGAFRMEVPLVDLVRIGVGGQAQAQAESRPPDTGTQWSGTAGDPSFEADLRGLRVDEVELALARALDRAVLGGLTEVRVIHGKGTGAVRRRVEELLQTEGRVEAFRLGRQGEGGTGVTVVTVR